MAMKIPRSPRASRGTSVAGHPSESYGFVALPLAGCHPTEVLAKLHLSESMATASDPHPLRDYTLSVQAMYI